MTNFQKFSYFLLRIGMGILFFSAGWVKITDSSWNEWGLTLIGIALLLGVFVRLASLFGFIMMILYYLPAYPPDHGLIDGHIVYSLVFLVFMSYGSGKILTLNNWIQTRLHPMWHKWVD